jgi:transposase
LTSVSSASRVAKSPPSENTETTSGTPPSIEVDETAFGDVAPLAESKNPNLEPFCMGILPADPLLLTPIFTNSSALLAKSLSTSALGSQKEISPNTVSNIATEKLEKRLKETASRRVTCPTELEIDEHFFSKKDGFATTLVDLKKNQVFDVVLGRSELSLAGYLKKLKGKENVKLVVMDLSEPYRSIIQKHFPNARIVAARFHVVRVVMQHFSRLWHIISPEIKWRRGLGKLFRMHSWNLNDKQSEKLGDYLQKNEVVGQIYAKRNEISELLTRRNQKGFQIRKNVTELLKMIEELKQSPFPLMKTLATTLESWSAEIGRMWSSSKSNGVTEGFHNKMEVISRRAFGYKNFQNYRNRVLAMSKWNGKQSRRTFSWRKKRHPIEPKETAKQAAA